MKQTATLLLLLLLAAQGMAQPTFSRDVSPIIYGHCTTCHRPGEIGPFPLTNYAEASAYASMIAYVTSLRIMPPWKADPNYKHLLDENVLTDAEIQTIQDWVAAGAPQGNPSEEAPLPQFPAGSELGTPDLQLAFAQSYTHAGTNTDEYRVFVLPTGLTEDKAVTALEFRPGNRSIVHHALFSWDTTGTAAALDAADPEYGFSSFGGSGVTGSFENQYPAYVPGQRARFFPEGMGQSMYKNSDLLIQVHYAPTPVAETDSSVVNIYFSDQPNVREIYNHIMLPFAGTLTNGPFIIPANQVKTFHGTLTVPFDVSLLAISPHMHLLGQDWLVYAVSPSGDTTRLISIPEWDFNWQGTYRFPNLIKITAGSTIHAFATYDNTSANPFNPNSPPRLVTWGERTQDEMYYLPLTYTFYQPGDEQMVLTGNEEFDALFEQHKLYPIYPNPVGGEAQAGFELKSAAEVSARLLSMEGKEVARLLDGQRFGPGHHAIRFETGNFAAGMYFLEVRAGEWAAREKWVLTR